MLYLRFDLLQPAPKQTYRHIVTVLLRQSLTTSATLCASTQAEMTEAGFTGTATGVPDDNAAGVKAATQVPAVATMCIVQTFGLFSWTCLESRLVA